ncbi:unnamed protein product [Ceutorhynchus assimilis]|uniref:Ig-like domain-containing protein n=1 Tax=Ceutorhynchus assimilis TaxID=467358 RepID=A0A9N9MBZ3_9CUCU|nr:unnamed protein product [Ceutorhynchus assimilis]
MSNRIIHSNQSLVLQKVTKQSAGVYRCSVVNSEGETVSDELHFRVQYAPTCKNDKIVIVGASRGENIDVVCEIESDPPAKSYKWKFNNSGETLELEPERFSKTSNGSSSILKYTPVTELDYGSLSCWASNILGHQVNPCLFQVVAAGKPFPVKNCTLTNQTSNSVEVYCQPGFDGGLPQHFLLELHTVNSLVPQYNVTSYSEPYFFLEHLETDVTFKIMVFAVNSKGRSVAVILEEITLKEKRAGAAENEDNHLMSLNVSEEPLSDLFLRHPSSVAPLAVNQYQQSTNPVPMVGTFPRDSRPRDLCVGNGNSSTVLTRTSDFEINGLAIKERLMANRLPESCV